MLKDKPALIVDIIKDAEKAFSYTQENIIEKELTKETIMADEKVKKIEDLKIGDLVIGDEKWGKVKQNSKTNEMYYAYRGGVRDGSIDAYVGLKIENLIEVSDFEKELAVEEPEKRNLVNDKKRQEFYNKIGIDPTEPLFAGGKSLQDITIEVNTPVYEPEDYNTPDRKLTLSADDVLADAFMSYEKYEEGMPFPGWYQYEKDIPLAEIKNIDDFLSEKNLI
ncbi:MAG TPA: hypothetical protein DDW88_02455 [Treponema sp.]|nr:hypothetical protein [Treponema sp.]